MAFQSLLLGYAFHLLHPPLVPCLALLFLLRVSQPAAFEHGVVGMSQKRLRGFLSMESVILIRLRGESPSFVFFFCFFL